MWSKSPKCLLGLGDSALLMQDLPDEYVDLVVTSPPYDGLRTYNGYSFDFEAIANELKRILKPGGVIVWVVGDSTVKGSESGTSFRQALYFKSIGLNLHDTMIYRKQNYIPLTHNRYEQEFEYMFVLSKGRPKTFQPIKIQAKQAGMSKVAGGFWKTSEFYEYTPKYKVVNQQKIKGNIWGYLVGNTSPEAKQWRHPAKYPLQLALDHVTSWSNPGDVVLDPFLGSGTTAEAALKLERKFIGIEISDEYMQIATKRIGA